jgi:hypothetical protein
MLKNIIHRWLFPRILAGWGGEQDPETLFKFLMNAEDPELLKNCKQKQGIPAKREALKGFELLRGEALAVPAKVLPDKGGLFLVTERLNLKFFPSQPPLDRLEDLAI